MPARVMRGAAFVVAAALCSCAGETEPTDPAGTGGASGSTVSSSLVASSSSAFSLWPCDGCERCAPGQACSAGRCACTGETASLAEVMPIFAGACGAAAKCHGDGGTLGLILDEAATAHATLVGVDVAQCTAPRVRVVPGAPEQSYLIQKIIGCDICTGNLMPPAGMLSDDDVALIARWICAGAPSE